MIKKPKPPTPPLVKQRPATNKSSITRIDAEEGPRTVYTSPRGNVSRVSQGNFDLKKASKNRLGRTVR